jgi:hypothetical protein
MGMKWEAVLKWDRVLPAGKPGNGRKGREGEGWKVGRDTVILAICWDDWEGGEREKVRAVMER